MNWHWLLEILEEAMPREDIVLANAFKTPMIAEAQIKTDKVDSRILADLLRANLISKVHICGKGTRELKEVLRQRCFFVRQRAMVRNRIHRLLSAQHGLKLPHTAPAMLLVAPARRSCAPALLAGLRAGVSTLYRTKHRQHERIVASVGF